MGKILHARSEIIALLIGALFTAGAAAQTNSDIVTINGGLRAVFVKPPVYSTRKTPSLPAGLVRIYGNLGQSGQTYNANSGPGILGRDVSGQPLPQAVATAFTPTAQHVVQVIEVGVTYVQGTNGIVVSLNEDNNGVPGNRLGAQTFTNLPVFGSCCTLQIARQPGILVKANTQYWVVVAPLASDTYCVWNDNYRGIQGTWANDTGQGWHSSFQVLGSLAVFGQ
jgi:hypothetical protein